jgi:hypothetical protein
LSTGQSRPAGGAPQATSQAQARISQLSAGSQRACSQRACSQQPPAAPAAASSASRRPPGRAQLGDERLQLAVAGGQALGVLPLLLHRRRVALQLAADLVDVRLQLAHGAALRAPGGGLRRG